MPETSVKISNFEIFKCTKFKLNHLISLHQLKKTTLNKWCIHQNLKKLFSNWRFSARPNLVSMNDMLSKPKLIILDSYSNPSGILTYFEGCEEFETPIRRPFWLRGVPDGHVRGVHAHKREKQVVICLKGRVDVTLDCLDKEKYLFELDSPDKGLIVPPMTWSSFTFYENAILLVLSDQNFDEEDYIRDRGYYESMQNQYLSGKL
jgi:hypothetical protein